MHLTSTRTVILVALALAPAGDVLAQSLSCPAVSTPNVFDGTAFQTECTTGTTTGCTSKAGVSWDPVGGVLTLPGSAGNFQGPPNAAVNANVFFAAPGDFDRDGWTDFVAADDGDKVYVMRNQTITCGTGSCSGSTSVAPTVQTIAPSWWNTLANKRPAAFRMTTTDAATPAERPLLSRLSISPQGYTPLAAGDFDGDGWTDFIQISYTHVPASTVDVWPTAARLFLNTKNCRLTSSVTNHQPCGIGMLCTGQPANGACTGGSVTNGTPWTETQLSCVNTNRCPYYMPTFATYDLLTGAAISTARNTNTTPTSGNATKKPGEFGPLGHPVQNVVVLDWDGDGDLDLLYGHGGGPCPGSLCTTSTFYPGIDVWQNDCAQAGSWNPVTKACPGHIPKFTKSTSGTCNATSCNNPDVLIPSTAHNTTTIAPNTFLGFDYTNTVSGRSSDHRTPGFAYIDIDKDGDYDLVLGSPGCCNTSTNYKNRLRVFKGTSNSKTVHTLDTANPIPLATSHGTYAGFTGALTGVFVHDFSGDGYPDIITGSDGYSYSNSIGGRTRYWKHTGDPANPYGRNWPTCSSNPAACVGCSSTCNPEATTNISENCGGNACATTLATNPPKFPDFDMGLMLDYDHDPSNTLDMVLTNGNTSNEFYIFPNRASPSQVAACGTVSSGLLNTPADESTVTGACLTPTATLPSGTSITYYLNNEDPPNYILACKQTQSGFTPASCCASFPNITGKHITWKAEFDSNSADDATSNPCGLTGTTSPTITGLSANYTYNAASQHYRAGVVVSDGVSYVGSFRQPGNRGSFYALAAGDGSKYYDAATKLDAQATRRIYTTSNVGEALARIDFNPASPSAGLIARVGATSSAEATNIITWVRSARFGLGATLSRLGAVMSSTPAILTPPFRPSWYAYLSATEKATYDAFSTTNANRVPLAIFGSMDGMVHAVISKATDIGNTKNGEEAWAFVPPYVAANMKSDYAASCTPSCAAGTLSVTAYPDGSPTLLDYKKSDNTIATVALIGDGAGGSSLTALDVTNTIDTSFAVSGPTPMWSQLPGDAAAGKATSKPGVARVRIGGFEKYVVVAGTGIHASDPTKGNVVAGYDLEAGTLLWKFEMACALTSDVTIFETDDTGELGSSLAIDGYADRAVFGDACGNLYKIDPGVDLAGAYMDNTGFGSISIGTSNGVERFAVFSTTQSGALGVGGERPIVGAIGAKTDATTDMILFFGTGGLEGFDPSKVNEFYAVRAKDGTIRNKVTGTCVGGKCEKFYGGVVITTDMVILQRTIDPVVTGVPGGCDYGSSKVQFLNVSTFAEVDVVDSIGGQPIAASSGSLYGDANALYFATVSGEIKRIGAPRATVAGEDTANNNMNQSAGAGSTSYESPFTLMGWRVVL